MFAGWLQNNVDPFAVNVKGVGYLQAVTLISIIQIFVNIYGVLRYSILLVLGTLFHL